MVTRGGGGFEGRTKIVGGVVGFIVAAALALFDVNFLGETRHGFGVVERKYALVLFVVLSAYVVVQTWSLCGDKFCSGAGDWGF